MGTSLNLKGIPSNVMSTRPVASDLAANRHWDIHFIGLRLLLDTGSIEA